MPYITCVATAVPPYKIAQTALAKAMKSYLPLSAKEKRIIDLVYKASAIAFRYSVLEGYTEIDSVHLLGETAPSTAKRMEAYQHFAPVLGLQASRQVLALRNLPAQDITHLITFSCTGFYAPGLDIDVVQGLGLPASTPRWHIGFMGCYAAFNALRLADTICQAEPNAKVLLVGVELCTLHLQHNTTEDAILSGALFADGATSFIVESAPAKHLPALQIEALHTALYPQGAKDMAWQIGDTGFDMRLSAYVPTLLQGEMKGMVEILLHKINAQDTEIDYFAIHPGGRRILEAAEKALHISPTDNAFSYAILREYGNMSSVTVLFVLERLLASLTDEDANKHVLSMAFGPGLTVEAGLFKVVLPTR